MRTTVDDKVTMAVATGVFLGAIWFFSWPGVIATFAALFALVLAYNVLWIRPRVNAANALLFRDGDPAAFLEAMDDVLHGRILPTASAAKTRAALVVNRTAGLFFAGRFGEALEVLRGIDADELPAPFPHLHFNNELACLVATDDAAGAQRLVEGRPWLLEPPANQPDVALALQGNQAGLARLRGDRVRSREILMSLLTDLERPSDARGPLLVAFTRFQLGRLDLDEGRSEEAKAHFTEAVRLAPKTFLPRAVEELLGGA
jgi:hypothetical protein